VEIFLFLNYNQNGLDIVIFFAHKQFIYPNLTTFTKWSYLCKMASKQKTKRTFTSQTFEIGEKKVHLVFGLELNWMRYGHVLNQASNPNKHKATGNSL
jgi:hypothetical protein